MRKTMVIILAALLAAPLSAALDPAAMAVLSYPAVLAEGEGTIEGGELSPDDLMPIAIGTLLSESGIQSIDFISGNEARMAIAFLDALLFGAEMEDVTPYAARGTVSAMISEKRGDIGYEVSYDGFSFAYATARDTASSAIDGSIYGWISLSVDPLASLAIGTDGISIGGTAYDASESRVDVRFDRDAAELFLSSHGIDGEAEADELLDDIGALPYFSEEGLERAAYAIAAAAKAVEIDALAEIAPAFSFSFYQDGKELEADLAESLRIYLALAEGYLE